jgi:predicted nucleic acid-binding protein
MFHLDTDVLIWACSRSGGERSRLFEILEAGEDLSMSAWAWYEFRRGPRTPEQLAAADVLLGDGGIVPVSADIVEKAAEIFRLLGSPRSRAANVLIGVAATWIGARLLTRNARDFAGIPDLDIEVVRA